MRQIHYLIMITFFLIYSQQISSQTKIEKEVADVMSEAYRKYWNAEVQAKIDSNINQFRKADAILNFENFPKGTKIDIEQISHSFLFGGNIFLFGDLKSPELNKKYEDVFGNLFNAATVPFYWKTLEPEQGKPRYTSNSSYEFRRPATDPVVDFCESKGINMNGHAIIYGIRVWGQPTWMPEDRKTMEPFFEAHIRELGERYKDRIQRWDVVNESIDQINRGLMPDDYSYKSFSWAMKYFPENVQFNTNDCNMDYDVKTIRRYMEIIRNLIDRGIRIDNAGIQMHIFNEGVDNIAKGEDLLTPDKIYTALDNLSEAGRPIHISEVTVAAPDSTKTGKEIQAEVAKNLYRLCFGYPNSVGITWWNVVDGGAAPKEPSTSGLFTTNMNPKPVYFVLDDLINNKWKTKFTTKNGRDNTIKFRGFKGKYRITWKNKHGKTESREFYLKDNGDGFINTNK